MSIRLHSRTENTPGFRSAFASLGEEPREIWVRFLDLAPPGRAEFWVAFDGDRAVGRVGASLMSGHPDVGAIGFFEARTEGAAHELIGCAEGWLRGRGMRQVVGPMALNTWFPYRFRVDTDERSFAWEPSNPGEYPRWFSGRGYEPVEHYHTVGSRGLAAYAEKTRPHWERAHAQGFTFRSFDGAAVLEREVPLLHELSLAGFRDNYLFEPIPLAYFRELYVPMARKVDFSHAFFALSPEGREVGFLFAFPDGEYLVLKSATVLPEYRGRGLSTALTHLAARRGADIGMDRFISALVRTGNRSESYARKAETLWEHRYALFGKNL